MTNRITIENMPVGSSGYTVAAALHSKDARYFLLKDCNVRPEHSARVTPLLVTRTATGYEVDIGGVREGERDWRGNGRDTGYGHPEVALVKNGDDVVYQKVEARFEPDPIPAQLQRHRRVCDLKVGETAFAGRGVIYRQTKTKHTQHNFGISPERSDGCPVVVIRTATGYHIDIQHVPPVTRLFDNPGFGIHQHDVLGVFGFVVEAKAA